MTSAFASILVRLKKESMAESRGCKTSERSISKLKKNSGQCWQMYFAYDWKAFDMKNTTCIECYCLTEQSERHKIAMYGFKPYCYVVSADRCSETALMDLILEIVREASISLAASPQTVCMTSTKNMINSQRYVMLRFLTWRDM